MDWNDLRVVLALARFGSVRAAGARLGVSHSTVARRLESLEAALGARLFDRGADGYTPTTAGRRVLATAERVERDMADLERGVVGEDERVAGPVGVTCGERYVCEVVMAGLVDACARFPGLEPRVTVDGRPFDLAKREADVAVRALGRGEQPPEYLLGTRIAPVVLATYVGREHADRLDPGRGGTPDRWLAFDDPRMVEFLVSGSRFPALPTWGRFGSLEAMVLACRAGLGLSMLPVYVGDREPELRRLSHPDLRHVGDLWLLCHPDLRHTGRVRAVRAAIAAAFQAEASRFEGRSDSGTAGPDFAPAAPPGADVP